jgi:hypothetical protein
MILESHRGGGLPGIRAFDGVIGVYKLGQAASAPAIVTGIQDVRRPDELQVKARGVYVNMAKRIVARGWDGVGKRTGLIFEQDQQGARADTEIGGHGIDKLDRRAGGIPNDFLIILQPARLA